MSAAAPAVRENPQLDLAALRRLKYDELERLYRASKRPSALSDLNGDAVGAMPAWCTPRTGPLAWLLRNVWRIVNLCVEGKILPESQRRSR